MRTLAEIISVIKKIKHLNNDAEVAIALGIKPKTLATAKTRNSIPFEELAAFCNKGGTSLDWLLTGKYPAKTDWPFEVYKRVPISNIDGEATYSTSLGPMTVSVICASMGIDINGFDAWLEEHKRQLSEHCRWLEEKGKREGKTLRISEKGIDYIADDFDPDLDLLFSKLKTIYRGGTFDQRARLRGTLDLLFDELKKQSGDSQQDEGSGSSAAG